MEKLDVTARTTQPRFCEAAEKRREGSEDRKGGLTSLLMFAQDFLAVAPKVLYALKIPAGPYGEAINSLNSALSIS